MSKSVTITSIIKAVDLTVHRVSHKLMMMVLVRGGKGLFCMILRQVKLMIERCWRCTLSGYKYLDYL